MSRASSHSLHETPRRVPLNRQAHAWPLRAASAEGHPDDSRRHVAVVMGKWNCAVRVYCPPEEWDAVSATLRWGEAEGKRQREG